MIIGDLPKIRDMDSGGNDTEKAESTSGELRLRWVLIVPVVVVGVLVGAVYGQAAIPLSVLGGQSADAPATASPTATNTPVPDTDGDGLDNQRESTLGTNPNSADTDGDGLSDAAEINEYNTNATNPDTDGDGLNDSQETNLETNPTHNDTDTDNLTDGTELNEGTDPTSADTDGDGLNDSFEVAHAFVNATNPDTDGDGLSDYTELRETPHTHPNEVDSDGDGATDVEETNSGADPTSVDTDGDGLSNTYEVTHGLPVDNPDADGDGLTDGAELKKPYFEGASPHQKDIFVELDYTAEATQFEYVQLNQQTFKEVKNEFAEQGIDLHIKIADAPINATKDLGGTFPDRVGHLGEYVATARNHSQYHAKGHEYALFVAEYSGASRTSLAGAPYSRGSYKGVVIETNGSLLGGLFMHELGHSLGLEDKTFDGIDSHKYTYKEYTSVMNYNGDLGDPDYSDGPPFNGWEYVKEHLDETTPSTSNVSVSNGRDY